MLEDLFVGASTSPRVRGFTLSGPEFTGEVEDWRLILREDAHFLLLRRRGSLKGFVSYSPRDVPESLRSVSVTI